MKPETIRRIDKWLGIPACFKLTCLRKIAGLFASPSRETAPVKKILFIKLIEQGATVLAWAAIDRAAEMVGRQNVYFLVFEENREILHLLGAVPQDNILTIRNRGLMTFLGDVIKNLWIIRRRRIDAAVDMEFFARASAVLSYLTGVGTRVGLHRFNSELPYRGDLLTHRLQYNPHLHTSQAYLLLVEALQLPPGETPMPKTIAPPLPGLPPAFTPTAAERARLEEMLHGADGAKGRPVIILNPNASDMLPLRKWPLENFLALGAKILRDYPGALLVITGAPAEKDAAQEMCRKLDSPRVVNLAGKTSLRELLVLYTLSDLLVTNDSGPAHFSSLAGLRSIVLYGPETPALFGPLGNASSVLYADLACSPCVNPFNHRFSPCRDNRCMKAILPAEVYEKIREVLGS